MHSIIIDNVSYPIVDLNDTSRLLINHAALRASVLGPDNLDSADIDLFNSIISTCIEGGDNLVLYIEDNVDLCNIIIKLAYNI